MMRNDRTKQRWHMLAAIAMATLTAGASAQNAPTPAPMKGLDNFSLQPSRPTPTPTPAASPSAAPTLTIPVVVVPVPTPSATPTARPTARPTPRKPVPAPSASATPEPVTSPAPTSTPAEPAPAPTSVPTVAPQDAPSGSIPIWAIVAGALSLGALAGLFLLRLRRTADVEIVGEAPFIPPAPADLATVPAAPAPRFLEPVPPPPPERAWIDLSVTARRAGVNLVTATADVDVTLHNSGAAAATAIRLDVRLLSAGTGQDDELGALFATAVDRPATPPFDLAPDETRTIRTLATLPRDAINVLTAADRPMFVPVLAINTRYSAAGDTTGQTAAAYAIGIERDGAAKLAPFWLDGPTRMYDALAVRPHALALKS